MQHSSCRIVQQFENIVEALIQQENFTNISVIAEDVALVAERVSFYSNTVLIHFIDKHNACINYRYYYEHVCNYYYK